MSEPSDERIYNLLPAIYRLKDAREGEPLRALMAVIEVEAKAIESDIDGLYDNWFIETCDEWVVPYIGDLLGVRGQHNFGPGSFSQRAYVANTLAYRRRKGTALVLEQISRDVTGWPAMALEFFRLLAAFQNLNYVSPDRLGTPDLRMSESLELVDGPFDVTAHTADVRSASSGGGRYNIPNIGIFLWRLQSYYVIKSSPRKFDDRRYWFSPLGYDGPLFNRPQTEMEITHLAEEINVPGRLRRLPLYRELEACRQALADKKERKSLYFGAQPVLQVFVKYAGDTEGLKEIPSEEILICNLGEWTTPPEKKKYVHYTGDGTAFEVYLKVQVAIDPVLGRLAFPATVNPEAVLVSYSYAFSGDIGGGPYNRHDSVQRWINPVERKPTWRMGVTQEEKVLSEASDPGLLKTTLKEAIDAWNEHASINQASGLITIMDSRSYDVSSLPKIEIPEGSSLAIAAAGWPQVEIDGESKRLMNQMVADDLRPHLSGDISVLGNASDSSRSPGTLVLDGLLIEGSLTVEPGSLGSLGIYHSTLVPDRGGLEVLKTDSQNDQNAQLEIEIRHSICGPIRLPATIPELSIKGSIIGKAGSPAIDAVGSNLDVQESTVFGTVHVRSIEAGNSIFTGNVRAERTQIGCVRFSYLPLDSKTPRRYRCQPEMAFKAPVFTSITYGHPGYAQLSRASAEEIFTGAEDGSEMGAFSSLKQPQREANLRTSLDEYLRFGLEAELFYVD